MWSPASHARAGPGSRGCRPSVRASESRSCGATYARKTRHTTHLKDLPPAVRILRQGHAFEGKELAVLGRCGRAGQLHLLLILPGESRSLIPASWTDLRTRMGVAADVATGAPQELHGTIKDLFKA